MAMVVAVVGEAAVEAVGMAQVAWRVAVGTGDQWEAGAAWTAA